MVGNITEQLYETKGVIVNKNGEIIAQAAKKHEMIVPQSGWAEHRPIEDWWGVETRATRVLNYSREF